jgi:polyhydroxybutyrate depolymerase
MIRDSALLRVKAFMMAVLLVLLMPVSMSYAQTLTAPPAEPTCSISAPCAVAGGFYLVRPPAGRSGKPPAATLVFFHGWRESAAGTIADPVLTTFADKHNILLVAPHGQGETWSYPGSPGKHRDEFAFTAAMLDDLAIRFKVDPARLIASGFSQGGSMVWNLACRMADRFAVFAPVAGGFWEPSPQSCTSGPVALIHLHGIKDGTVPMAGRSLRGGVYKQADIRRDWRVWLAANGCAVPLGDVVMPGEVAPGDFACQRATSCTSAKPLALCLRDGGHMLMAEDLETAWSFAQVAMKKP